MVNPKDPSAAEGVSLAWTSVPDADSHVPDLPPHIPAVVKSLLGITSDARDTAGFRFEVAGKVLAELPNALVAWRNCLAELIDFVLACVIEAGRWPEGQPDRLFAALLHEITDSTCPTTSKAAQEALHALLVSLGVRRNKARELLWPQQDRLIVLCLARIDRDVFPDISGASPFEVPIGRGYPVAMMLAVAHNRIRNPRSRQRVLAQLSKMSELRAEDYASPVIQDLLLCNRWMNLDHLLSSEE